MLYITRFALNQILMYSMTYFLNPTWLRRGLQCLTVVSLLLSQACSDDDDNSNTNGNGNNETTDKTPPTVAFSNLTDGQSVRNTIKPSVTASDENGIQKVDIYIDGTLLTSITATPFETTWDTNNATDGQHTIKAVATDKNGNTADKSLTVSVSNILVTINTSANQLFSGSDGSERGFVFLSDANGKLLASTEYKNGQKVELKSTGFDGESFFLTEVLVTSSSGNKDDLRVWTFASIERGKNWVVLNNDEDKDTYIGDVSLSFKNIAQDSHYVIAANGTRFLADENSTTGTVSISKNPTKLYVVRGSNADSKPLGYSLISDVAMGSTYDLDLSTVTKTLTKETGDVPDYAESIAYGLYGYPVANDYTERYDLGEFHSSIDDDTFDFYYPGSAFPSYTSELEVHGNGFTTYRQNTEPAYNPEKMEASASFTFSNNKLTVSTTGSLDLIAIPFDDGRTLWYYMLPQGQNQIIPSLEVPQLLNAWTFPGLDQPVSYELYDFNNINSYSDLKTFVRGSSNSIDELFNPGKSYLEMDVDNGTGVGRTSNSRDVNVSTTRSKK